MPAGASANPAITIARSLTDADAGIRPQDALKFVLSQFAGASAAHYVACWLFLLPGKSPAVGIVGQFEKGATMLKYAIEMIGWVAASLMLSAYLLLTAGKVSGESRLYHWLNALSGAGFIVKSG